MIPIEKEMEQTIDQMIDRQKQLLLTLGRRIIPALTSDDILQPNDYPQLEGHPEFRYEEGVLAGMQVIQTALRYIHSERHFSG